MGIFEEITKGTVVDVNTAPAKAAQSQVDRVRLEIENTSPEGLKAYVLEKAKEFEMLRLQYERQLDWAKAEMKRLGIAADSNTLKAVREGFKARDLEWLNVIQVRYPGAAIAMENGLIAIGATLEMLEKKLKK